MHIHHVHMQRHSCVYTNHRFYVAVHIICKAMKMLAIAKNVHVIPCSMVFLI